MTPYLLRKTRYDARPCGLHPSFATPSGRSIPYEHLYWEGGRGSNSLQCPPPLAYSGRRVGRGPPAKRTLSTISRHRHVKEGSTPLPTRGSETHQFNSHRKGRERCPRRKLTSTGMQGGGGRGHPPPISLCCSSLPDSSAPRQF